MLYYNQSVQIRLAHRLHTDVQYFLDILGVNRQATYRTRSEGQNILHYIGCTREAEIRPGIF